MEKNLSNMDEKMSIIAEKTSITAWKMSNIVPQRTHPWWIEIRRLWFPPNGNRRQIIL